MPIIREQVEVRTFRKELYAEERMCLAEALGGRGWVRGSRVCDIVSRASSMAGPRASCQIAGLLWISKDVRVNVSRHWERGRERVKVSGR